MFISLFLPLFMVAGQIQAQAVAAQSSGIWIDKAIILLIMTNLGMLFKEVVVIAFKKVFLKPPAKRPCDDHEGRLKTLEENDVPEKREKISTMERELCGLKGEMTKFREEVGTQMETQRKENREDHKEIFALLRGKNTEKN